MDAVTPKELVQNVQQKLLDSTGSLLESGRYSDMAIRCQDKVYNVHRALVCSRSAVFAAMIDGPFRESEAREINLEGDEPEIVEAMLSFLYYGNYHTCEKKRLGDPHESATPSEDRDFWVNPQSSITPPTVRLTHIALLSAGSAAAAAAAATEQAEPSPNAPQPGGWSNDSVGTGDWGSQAEPTPLMVDNPLMYHAKIYILADKYDITALKDLVVLKFSQLQYWTWGIDILDFIAAAEHLYANTMETDQQLRRLISKLASQNMTKLFRESRWEEVLKAHVELSVDVNKWNSSDYAKLHGLEPCDASGQWAEEW